MAEKIPDSVRRVVTAKTQCKIQNAREYFEEHLCVGDYYDEGQRVAGEWFGLGKPVSIAAGRTSLTVHENSKIIIAGHVAQLA